MEDKLQKLEKIVGLVESDKITRDEFGQVFESFLQVVQDLKSQMENQISGNEVETIKKIKKVIDNLNNLESRAESLIDNLKETSSSQIRDLYNRLYTEVGRIEKSIPKMPDLSYLDVKISEVEAKIPKIREEVRSDTPSIVRDKLESLKDDERLDISAIKGFGNKTAKLSDEIINRAIGIVDQRTSFLINKVSNLQDRVNNFNNSGNGNFVSKTGDTMTGPLVITPTSGTKALTANANIVLKLGQKFIFNGN